MSILNALARYLGVSARQVDGTYSPPREQQRLAVEARELPPRALYAFLQGLYLTNGAYDDYRDRLAASGALPLNVRPIRNPVSSAVNVLGSKLYPRPLRVTTPKTAGVTSQQERERIEASDPVKAAIDQVHRWSNFPRAARKHARWVALYGEAFTKVVANGETGRVYFEQLEPQHVTAYQMDERDYLTSCRIDILQRDRSAGGVGLYTYTEAWDRDLGTLRVWRTTGDARDTELDDLRSTPEETPLSAFGIDFVPVVRTPFMELDDGRAIGAVELAVEAILEADLSATNLHSLIFSDLAGAKVLQSSGIDAFGRPLPPPVVRESSEDGKPGRQSDGSVLVGKHGGREFWQLPAGQTLVDVIPNIDYDAALAVLRDHDEVLREKMPALAYLRITELSGGDLSGKAIAYKLRPFVDQVEEGRENVLASLQQADHMALTMGQAAGIFRGLGSYERGDFDHDFEPVPVLTMSSLDDAEEARTRGQAAQALTSAGVPMSYVLTETLRLSEAEATELTEAAADAAAEAFERQQALMAAQGDDTEDDDQEAE